MLAVLWRLSARTAPLIRWLPSNLVLRAIRVQRRVSAHKWKYVETAVRDSRKLENINDGTFSHAFLNFGASGPEDPDGLKRTVAEVFRVLKVGGVAMFSIWAGKLLKHTCRVHD